MLGNINSSSFSWVCIWTLIHGKHWYLLSGEEDGTLDFWPLSDVVFMKCLDVTHHHKSAQGTNCVQCWLNLGKACLDPTFVPGRTSGRTVHSCFLLKPSSHMPAGQWTGQLGHLSHPHGGPCYWPTLSLKNGSPSACISMLPQRTAMSPSAPLNNKFEGL